ncbi:hypothetical protein GCM10022236_52170 [Microlunatus ginsengisoli]|uniref:Uncharacterized protein n=2 Tax=Microlunatus ginsengisoli TaxID=363863 RepID=A0ABP7AZ64_9ACTN
MKNMARSVAAAISILVIITSSTIAHATPAARDGKAARDPSEPSLLSYRESGCTEISYQRGGQSSVLRPLVPERFTLTDFPPAPGRVYLTVTEVTCDRHHAPHRGSSRGAYTYLIVSAPVTATEGAQRGGEYVIFYVTEDRTQLTEFRRLGWPMTALSQHTRTQVTRDSDGVVLGAALDVVGAGWDHELAALASERPAGAETRTAEYYRDTPTGAQTLCFINQISVTPAIYSGDLRGTPFDTIAYAHGPLTAFSGWLVHGGWDATVTTQNCPT